MIALSADYLKKRGIQEPRLQAELLVASALQAKRLDLYMSFDKPLTEMELETCRTYLKRRGEGEPLPYIQGFTEFYDCRIKVNRSVLIPRQETEILVDKVAKVLEKEELSGKSLWDVCCGSGCIGIALKKKFPSLRVTLIDISQEALDLARKNAAANDADVTFVHGNLFQPVEGQLAHYVVCNPPYISEEEYARLDPQVKDWEPRTALVPGTSGMELYSTIAEQLKAFLFSGGRAWFEIGCSQGKHIIELFKKHQWTSCRVEKDWSGHDRFFSLENE